MTRDFHCVAGTASRPAWGFFESRSPTQPATAVLTSTQSLAPCEYEDVRQSAAPPSAAHRYLDNITTGRDAANDELVEQIIAWKRSRRA